MKRPKNPFILHEQSWAAFERGINETIALNEEEFEKTLKEGKKRKGKEEEKMEQ